MQAMEAVCPGDVCPGSAEGQLTMMAPVAQKDPARQPEHTWTGTWYQAVVKGVWESAGAGSRRWGRPLPLRFRGAGRRINPARSIRSNATRQLISLGCPAPLTQPNSSQTRRAKPERWS